MIRAAANVEACYYYGTNVCNVTAGHKLPSPAEHAVYFYASLPPIIFSSEVDQQFQIKKLFELINVQVGHHQLSKRLYTVCR